MVGSEHHSVAFIERLPQSILMATFVRNDAMVAPQVKIDQTEPLNETGPPIAAMGRNELIRLFEDDLLHDDQFVGVCQIGQVGFSQPARDNLPTSIQTRVLNCTLSAPTGNAVKD